MGNYPLMSKITGIFVLIIRAELAWEVVGETIASQERIVRILSPEQLPTRDGQFTHGNAGGLGLCRPDEDAAVVVGQHNHGPIARDGTNTFSPRGVNGVAVYQGQNPVGRQAGQVR